MTPKSETFIAQTKVLRSIHRNVQQQYGRFPLQSGATRESGWSQETFGSSRARCWSIGQVTDTTMRCAQCATPQGLEIRLGALRYPYRITRQHIGPQH